MTTPEELLASPRGFVEAPAGCGKTHLIAEAVSGSRAGRELILTHTHAGVRAIQGHLRRMGVSSSQYALMTIAGWCLLYAASFPMTSGIPTDRPRTPGEWDAVYSGVLDVLAGPVVARVPAVSYSGAIIDEYQDCTKQQHEVVKVLADLIPTRVLGDPLQGIFDFGGNKPVDWETDVRMGFETLPRLEEPWRWRNGCPDLGEWLCKVRKALLEGSPVDLRESPECVEWGELTKGNQTEILRDACFRLHRQVDGGLAVIRRMPEQSRHLASQLMGIYQCAEANEAPDLLNHAEQIQAASGVARAKAVLELVFRCSSGLKAPLSSIRGRLDAGEAPIPGRYKTNLPVAEAVAAVCGSDRFECVDYLVGKLLDASKSSVYRWEVLRDFRRGLAGLIAGEADTLVDAIWSVRDRSKRIGRTTPKRVIGTTKLLKGLEFETVLVVDAEMMERKDLYVALTRASRRLIILSQSPLLDPS